MKKATRTKKIVLGDLIAALFEEAKKVSKNRLEQNLLVYAALRDILRKRVHSMRPIAVRV
jgi:stress-induced morphogen